MFGFILALNQYSRSVEQLDGGGDVWSANRSFGMDRMDQCLVIAHDVHSYIYHMGCRSQVYDDGVDRGDDDDDKMGRNCWNRPNTVGLSCAMPCHSSGYAMWDFESFARALKLPTVVAVPYYNSHYSAHPDVFDYMLFGLLFQHLKSIKMEICIAINKQLSRKHSNRGKSSTPVKIRLLFPETVVGCGCRAARTFSWPFCSCACILFSISVDLFFEIEIRNNINESSFLFDRRQRVVVCFFWK